MKLNNTAIREYLQKGFYLFHHCLNTSEIDLITKESERVIGGNFPGTIFEKDGKTIRTVNGIHLNDPFFSNLCRYSKLLDPAMQILGSKVYVHQSKINTKRAFLDEIWEWHQDFTYWNREDGLPLPHLVTVAIYLDDVTEFNGPPVFVPGTHVLRTLGTDMREPSESDDWKMNFSSQLRYPMKKEVLVQLMAQKGLVGAKAKRGSVMLFHCDLLHGSLGNMTHLDRRILYISYNSIHNRPVTVARPRPEFIASSDFRALSPSSNLSPYCGCARLSLGEEEA